MEKTDFRVSICRKNRMIVGSERQAVYEFELVGVGWAKQYQVYVVLDKRRYSTPPSSEIRTHSV
jgi:hypothetical protein